jgi:hypothetical protein
MTTVQWRPAVNALTKPQSYSIQIVPRSISGYDKMAADLAAVNPNYNASLIRSVAPLIMAWIQNELISGRQVNLEDAFSFRLTCSGKLSKPDDPLLADDNLLNVRIYPSRNFVQAVRHAAQLERLPMNEKLPQISSTEDTKLKLANVLNPDGVLRLIGSNLWFDENDPDSGCVISGTKSGQIKQSTFASISNSAVLLVPEVPTQENPWNNEYTLSVTTQYTAHGTPRTGIYRRRLRTPLVVPGLGSVTPPETGILSSSDATPLVSVKGGVLTADERLRIQAVLDPLTDRLLLNLLDMKEGGVAGIEVEASANGNITLPGFSGSAVSSLEISVNSYATLRKLIRDKYSGRLVDILDVKLA